MSASACIRCIAGLPVSLVNYYFFVCKWQNKGIWWATWCPFTPLSCQPLGLEAFIREFVIWTLWSKTDWNVFVSVSFFRMPTTWCCYMTSVLKLLYSYFCYCFYRVSAEIQSSVTEWTGRFLSHLLFRMCSLFVIKTWRQFLEILYS